MCYDLYLVHPRCGHVKSIYGQTVYCEKMIEYGEVCLSTPGGSLPRDYDHILTTLEDEAYYHGTEDDVDTQYFNRNRKEPSFCSNCCKGTAEPRTKEEQILFLREYLGERALLKSKEYESKRKERERQREIHHLKKEQADRNDGLKGGNADRDPQGLQPEGGAEKDSRKD